MKASFTVCLLVLQTIWLEIQGFCYFSCPRSTPRNIICAVDPARGARLFSGKCPMWQENHCNSAEFKEVDMSDCLKRYSGVIPAYIKLRHLDTRFDLSKATYGMRPLPRFILLSNIVVRLAETRPWLIPILPTFGIYQLPFPMWPALN